MYIKYSRRRLTWVCCCWTRKYKNTAGNKFEQQSVAYMPNKNMKYQLKQDKAITAGTETTDLEVEYYF